jgi:hypothetical protein
MSNEFCNKLQTKFMNNWIDHEFIPEIVRECHDEVTSHQEEELDQRDRLAIESLFDLNSFFHFLIAGTIRKYISPQLFLMHLMMSMMSSFDTVMIHHFTKGVMKRLVAHRYSDFVIRYPSSFILSRLLTLMYGLESRVHHVMEVRDHLSSSCHDFHPE